MKSFAYLFFSSSLDRLTVSSVEPSFAPPSAGSALADLAAYRLRPFLSAERYGWIPAQIQIGLEEVRSRNWGRGYCLVYYS